MVLAIALLGCVALAAAMWSGYAAINLVPTELGLVQMSVAATFASAALVLFGIALAVRAVTASLAAPAVRPDLASPRSEPAAAAKSEPVAPVLAGAAAGAAGLAAGAALSREPSTSAADIRLEEFERDLFAPLPRPDEPAMPPMEPEPAFEPMADEEPLPEGAPVTEEAPQPEADVEPAIEASEAAPESEPEAAADPRPMPAPEPAPDAPAPGLLPDADLDALTAEAPAMPPLESLSVVGAYDSGGTRFTMYSDGSVTAANEAGTERFPSLDALRAHIAQTTGTGA